MTISRCTLSSLAILFLFATIHTEPATSQTSKPGDKATQNTTTRDRPAQRDQEAQIEAAATSKSKLALPFKRAWVYLTDSAVTLAPSLDSARIYLPVGGGIVVCLDRTTGSLLWSNEPGGLITSAVAVGENSVYFATRKLDQDGAEAGGSLRAVDKATGLTLWARDYPRAFASPLTLGADRIYAGSGDGSLYALRSSDGSVVWKVDTQDAVRGQALVGEKAIYFGGDDGALRAIEPERGQLVWRFQTGGKIVGRPALDSRSVYFGSGDGHFYSLDLTGKLRWRARVGAAIEASPTLVGDRVLVASFDNFIYALSRAAGDRVWKRRLDNRIAATPLVEGDAALVAPLRSSYVAVFLNSDGRRVNLYQLDRDFELIADPVFAGDTLVLPTNKGLVVAFVTNQADKGTNALKK